MKRRWCSLVLSVLLLGVVGCRHDAGAGPPTLAGDPLEPGGHPQHVAIEGLSPHLVAGQAVIEPSTENRPMRITVPIRSLTDRPLNVQYKFEFFDEDGRMLRSNQGYRFVHIEPRTQVHLDAGALETAADDWRLTVRPAR